MALNDVGDFSRLCLCRLGARDNCDEWGIIIAAEQWQWVCNQNRHAGSIDQRNRIEDLNGAGNR